MELENHKPKGENKIPSAERIFSQGINLPLSLLHNHLKAKLHTFLRHLSKNQIYTVINCDVILNSIMCIPSYNRNHFLTLMRKSL